MPYVAWYRRPEGHDWSVYMLFELDQEGRPVKIFRHAPQDPFPKFIVDDFWKRAVKLSEQRPEAQRLVEIDPIDLPLLEMELTLIQQQEHRLSRLKQVGGYFEIIASANREAEPETVGYGRVVSIIDPTHSEVVILGVLPDPRRIWQTFTLPTDPSGKRVETSKGLVPGGHYILYTGTKSMITDTSKTNIQYLRQEQGRWIHLADDVLDAPDLPPSDFQRR